MSAVFLLHSQPAIDPTQAQIGYLALDYSRFAEDNLLNWLPEVAKLLSWFQDLEDGIYSTLFNLPANLSRFILSRIDLSCLWY